MVCVIVWDMVATSINLIVIFFYSTKTVTDIPTSIVFVFAPAARVQLEQ